MESAQYRERTEDRRLLLRPEAGQRASDMARMDLCPDASMREVLPVPALTYGTLFAILIALGIGLVTYANLRFAPLLYTRGEIAEVAATLAEGRNYRTFDLNIDTRALRRAHIQMLRETPELALLGASHWQEAHATLLPETNFYNSHVHRDYYEDILSVTEMFVQNNRLPKQMIITIRDNTFLPIAERTDFLWLPGIPEYRRMAARLGIEPHPWLDTIPYPQLRDMMSLTLLWQNLRRFFTAEELPGPSHETSSRIFDTLLSDGSVNWSEQHKELFSRDYAKAKAVTFAQERRDDPPRIDPRGVEAVDRLLAFLGNRGVEVFLAHPPFNPDFYDRVMGTPYEAGLDEVIVTARRLAEKYGLEIIGSFDPYAVGCDSSMYIDGEHSGPACLQKVLHEFRKLDGPRELQAITAR